MSTKSKLLEILEKNKGGYLSGEELAGELGVSRAAVWKAMKALRAEGYPITAVNNRGYALAGDSDLLSEEAVRLGLRKKDVFVKVWKETASTNQKLKQMALEQKLPHGSIAAAECQSAGKGRKGRSFYSPRGSGLYLSVLLYPRKTARESLEITAAAAVAVCRAVERCCKVFLGIKWVNDLYLEDKKVCGILTEAVTDFETGDIEFAVVGIGLNLYEPEGGFPDILKEAAGAVLERGEGTDRNRLAAEIVNELLLEVEKPGISQEYISRNIVPGRQVRVSYGDCEETVLAKRILPDGSLLAEDGQGKEKVLPCGDVSLGLSKE